jgi:hypothetical protein
MIPLVQEAVGRSCEADTKAMRLGVDVDTFPEWIEARKRETAIEAKYTALREEMFRQPILCFDDLMIRAEIAHHGCCGKWPWTPGQVFHPCELTAPGVEVDAELGQLAIAVLTLGGRRFEASKPIPESVRAGVGDEIAAKAKALPSTVPGTPPRLEGASRLRGRWERALAAQRAAYADPAHTEAQTDEGDARLLALTHAIWRAGAKSVDDVRLFAEVALYWMWDPEDPDEHLAFRDALKLATRRLDEQSVAQLTNAVLALPEEVSPRPSATVDECPRPPTACVDAGLVSVAAEIRRLLPEVREASYRHNDAVSGSEGDDLEAAWRALEARLDALRQRVLDAPPSWERAVLLAEIAQYRAYDWPAPYPQVALTGGDYIDAPGRIDLGHVAVAVLQAAGRRVAE